MASRAEKAAKIISAARKGQFTKWAYRIEITDIAAIEGGVQIFARAWNNDAPVGLGPSRTTEIERFRIINPPILVDDPKGPIKRRSTNRDGSQQVRSLREDPEAAIREVLAETIRLLDKGTRPIPGTVGNTTSVFYPDSGTGGTTVDGSVGHDYGSPGSGQSWATIRAAGGNDGQDTGNDREIFQLAADNGGNRWLSLYRGIFLFDTSSILDGDTISSATFSIYGTSSGYQDNFNQSLVVTNSAPDSNNDLVNGDYNNNMSTEYGLSRLDITSWNQSGYNDISIDPAAISKVGITKLGTRCSADFDNSEPSWVANATARMFGRYADQTGTSNDPKVTVVHVTPAATSTHTIDALLKKSLSSTHTADTLLKKALTATHTADSLLKKVVASSHTIDSYIRQPTHTVSHTISTYLFKERLRLEKSLLARVSLPNGTFLTAWKNIDFHGYVKQINGGPGECVIDYAVPFDYDGADLREGNDVELLISDADTQLADTEDGTFGAPPIYRGYISLIERDIDSASERVRVHLLGYYTLLSMDVLKDGSQTTLYSHNTTGFTTTSGSQAAADIGLMTRTAIDRFNAERGSGRISYETADIPNTSTTATYTFAQKTYREALDILKSLAPANVYWYVNEIGRVRFKSPSSTPDHTFVFGRHFSKVFVERSLEKVRNAVLIWNGESIYKQYTDAASIALYGRRTERINDYGINNSNAADAVGAKFLAENKDAALKLRCVIIDNNNARGLGYDIETIQPGDTCSLAGFSSILSDIFRDNMLITRVHYTLDWVEIEVELTKSGLVDVQARQGRDIADIGSGGLGIPATYS